MVEWLPEMPSEKKYVKQTLVSKEDAATTGDAKRRLRGLK
jgi:hypothetical protein